MKSTQIPSKFQGLICVIKILDEIGLELSIPSPVATREKKFIYANFVISPPNSIVFQLCMF